VISPALVLKRVPCGADDIAEVELLERGIRSVAQGVLADEKAESGPARSRILANWLFAHVPDDDQAACHRAGHDIVLAFHVELDRLLAEMGRRAQN